MEGANLCRVTRRSAAFARAKICQIRWSKKNSSGGESNFDDSNQNYQSSDIESSDKSSKDVGSRKEDYDQQKRNWTKGIQHETAQWRSTGMNSPSAVDNMNKSEHLHTGHQLSVVSQPSLKDQMINEVAITNEDNSINLQVNFTAAKAFLNVSNNNTDHEKHAKKLSSDFVGIESNINNVSLGTKNTLPLTEKVSDNCESSPIVKDDNVMLIIDVESNTNEVKFVSKKTLPISEKDLGNHNSVPSESRINLETLRSVIRNKILDGNGQHPIVDKNEVSGNCESYHANKDSVMLTMDVGSNTNIVNLGSNDNLVTETKYLIQTPGKLVRKKGLDNNHSSPIVNCDHDLSDSGVRLENSGKIILDNIFNSNQQSVSSKSLHLENQLIMSHLTDTHKKKSETIERCIENCKRGCTKQLNCAGRCSKNGRKLINCPVCDKKIEKCKLAIHSVKHSDYRPHKCKLCPKTFKTIFCLQSHTRHIHENSFIKCNYCEKQYKSKMHFRRHIKMHKGIDPPKIECDICGKVFEKARMTRHISIHSKDYKFPCNICNKYFKNKEGLKSHISHVHNSKPRPQHTCKLCGLIMISPSALSDHMNTHSGTTPYTCDICEESFSSRRRLVAHLATLEGNKYKCEMCGHTCSRVENLTSHMRTHTGEKPYICSICSRTFTRVDNLRNHMRRQHKVE